MKKNSVMHTKQRFSRTYTERQKWQTLSYWISTSYLLELKSSIVLSTQKNLHYEHASNVRDIINNTLHMARMSEKKTDKKLYFAGFRANG